MTLSADSIKQVRRYTLPTNGKWHDQKESMLEGCYFTELVVIHTNND